MLRVHIIGLAVVAFGALVWMMARRGEAFSEIMPMSTPMPWLTGTIPPKETGLPGVNRVPLPVLTRKRRNDLIAAAAAAATAAVQLSADDESVTSDARGEFD